MGSTKLSKLVIGSPVQRSVKAIVRSIDTYHIDPYLMLAKSKGSSRTLTTNHDNQQAAETNSVGDDGNGEVRGTQDNHKSPVNDQEGKSDIVTSDIHDQVIITNVSDKENVLNNTELTAAADGTNLDHVKNTDIDDDYDNEIFDSPCDTDNKNTGVESLNKPVTPVKAISSPDRLSAAAKAPPSMLLSLQHQVKTINLKLAEKEPKTMRSKVAGQRQSLNTAGSKQNLSPTNRPDTQSSNEKSPCKHTSTYNREKAREYIKKQQTKRKLEMAHKGDDQNEVIRSRLNALKNTQRELVRANVTKRNRKSSQTLKASKSEPALRQNFSRENKGKPVLFHFDIK